MRYWTEWRGVSSVGSYATDVHHLIATPERSISGMTGRLASGD